VIATGKRITPFESYMIALHEIAHGIAGRDIDGNRTEDIPIGKNYLTGIKEHSPKDTLELMIGTRLSMPSAKRSEMIKEIMSLQDNEFFDNERDTPKGGRISEKPVRLTGPVKRKLQSEADASKKKRINKAVKNFEKYSRSTPEFTVDPLIMYLHNPKKMKEVAPVTANAIRAFFVASSNIKFYSHPLAMAIAAVMAVIMKQEQAEDEERQQQMQMPAGALNQPMPQGMLSA